MPKRLMKAVAPEPEPEPEQAFPKLSPDPRTIEYPCVSDILIDPQVQRELDQDTVFRWATDFRWDLAEVPTCRRLKNRQLLADEGQHRIAALRMRDPKAVLPVIVLPGVADKRSDAEVALAIAKARRGHSPYDRWQLKVHQGEPHEIAAEEALDRLGLRLGKATTARTLGCIKWVSELIHGKRRTPEAGADILSLVVTVIIAAYPDPKDLENSTTRWDNRMVKAVGTFIDRNPHVDADRLVKVLRQRTAQQWINEAASTTTKNVWSRIGEIIQFRYNKGLRDPDRKARW